MNASSSKQTTPWRGRNAHMFPLIQVSRSPLCCVSQGCHSAILTGDVPSRRGLRGIERVQLTCKSDALRGCITHTFVEWGHWRDAIWGKKCWVRDPEGMWERSSLQLVLTDDVHAFQGYECLQTLFAEKAYVNDTFFSKTWAHSLQKRSDPGYIWPDPLEPIQKWHIQQDGQTGFD